MVDPDLRREIAADEGCRLELYHDHLGLLTCGIGHLLTPADAEYGQPIGTPITMDRVNELFAQDLETAIDDCKEIFDRFDDLPQEARHVVINMAFNLGRTRLAKFKKMIAAIEASDWNEAANQMHDSKWRTQVPARAGRLIRRMRDI